jgi:uncharacterized membrane protein YdjX (TVP38/TMEM64 family)
VVSRLRARRRLLAVVLVALIVALGFALRGEVDALALRAWIQALGGWAPVGFLAVYLLAPALFVPGSVLTLAGGALFGPWWGALYSLVGATGGASLAFLIARYVAGDWVAARAGGRLARLVRGVEAEGWRFVVFVRLVPLFPFNLLNYLLGLTRIPLLAYALASFLAMAPGALAYSYLGFAGREALFGEATLSHGLWALGLLAVVAFIPRLVRRMRRAQSASAGSVGGAGSRPDGLGGRKKTP